MIAPDKDPITRLEVVLKGRKLTDFSSLGLNPRNKIIRKHPRLTGFTWEQLKTVHRHYFSGLKAVYHVAAEEGAKPEKGYAAVLAAIILEHDIDPIAIFDSVINLSGKKPDTCRNIRRQIEWHLGQASELTAEQLLSDEAYRTQPSIKVEGLGGCRFYVKRYGWSEIEEAMTDIQKVYGDPPKKSRTLESMRPYNKW